MERPQSALPNQPQPLWASEERSASSPADSKISAGRLAVKFAPETRVAFIESSWKNSNRSGAKMAKQVYETFAGNEVADDLLDEAARLFNENYGTWGQGSHKSGEPVKLSVRRLREQYLPDTAISSYTRVTVDGNLAGNAFVCRWKHRDNIVCWVTQLVVHKAYRERGLAGGLLKSLRADADEIYGIMSSHPAACLAAATCFGTTIEKVSLDFIRRNADAIMKASPIPYIKVQ